MARRFARKKRGAVCPVRTFRILCRDGGPVRPKICIRADQRRIDGRIRERDIRRRGLQRGELTASVLREMEKWVPQGSSAGSPDKTLPGQVVRRRPRSSVEPCEVRLSDAALPAHGDGRFDEREVRASWTIERPIKVRGMSTSWID